MMENIYLTGFMGAGKTTVGRGLSDLLRRKFVDMDELLTNRLGMPIPKAFEHLGEEAFRKAETAELTRVSRRNQLVVATGGGLPERLQNRRLLRQSGRVVHLDATLDACREHLASEDAGKRPLWRDQEKVARLFERRQKIYSECDFKVPVITQSADQVAEEVAKALLPERREQVKLDGSAHPLHISWDAPGALSQCAAGRRVVLLTDKRVSRLHLERYRMRLGRPPVVILPTGECAKSLRAAERVYRALLEAKVERGDFLVAIGGGVITDLGAFVAATYKRGVEFALASTSLLGCVDAAIGGKAAVNLGPEKNQVGCFTKPRAVVLDLRALGTLPRRRIVEGLAEAYKTGLAASPELAGIMESSLRNLLRGDLMALSRVVRLSAEAKARVVAEDFRENGCRRFLNLGHTFGHVLEGFNRFRIGHGQAVAVGIQVATAISRNRGLLDSETAERIHQTLLPLAPRKLEWPGAEEAWEAMLNDKKTIGGKVRFVLLRGAGDPLSADDVNLSELADAINLARSA